MPSTTATSLTSLGTGLPPGAHGLVGFTARIPGTDRLLNHLGWDKHVDPLEWQPNPPRSAVWPTPACTSRRSTSVTSPGPGSPWPPSVVRPTSVPTGSGERIAATVAASAHSPSLTYVYDSDLDWTGHKFGVSSSQWLQQLAMVDAEAEQLREALPPSARLLVRGRPRHGRQPGGVQGRRRRGGRHA